MLKEEPKMKAEKVSKDDPSPKQQAMIDVLRILDGLNSQAVTEVLANAIAQVAVGTMSSREDLEYILYMLGTLALKSYELNMGKQTGNA